MQSTVVLETAIRGRGRGVLCGQSTWLAVAIIIIVIPAGGGVITT